MNSNPLVLLTRIASPIRLFFAVVLAILALAPVCRAQNSSWVPGEYIIKFDERGVQDLKRRLPDPQAYTDAEIEEALTAVVGAETVRELDLIQARTVRAVSGDELDVSAAVDLLDARLVQYISPNYLRSIGKTPNDPSYASLWGLNQGNDIDIDAPEAWDAMPEDGAADVVVGVVDTGIDYRHPDLAANLWVNPAEAGGVPGIDDDSNGVVDDVHGYNAITKSGDPYDDHAHGTHVSGTIGASADNGVGVVGVAWKVKIMALKFLNAQGSGSDADAIDAIGYAVQMRNRGGHLKVLNNSWGGGGYDEALKQAIDAANDAGILFVAAAGNSASDNDAAPTYPANYDNPNVVSVAAVAQDGSLASFSCYGLQSVDVAAPGVGILSTVPGGGYRSMNGTSMATPHVSGVAALAYSRMLQYSPAETKAMLLASVKPGTALAGKMAAPGIVSARNAAADPSNYPPDLQPIADQVVSSRTRIKTVPLIGLDREGDGLSYSASIVLPRKEAAAAAADQTYGFTAYLEQYDNYYRIGEKHLQTENGGRFFVFSDGTVAELLYPYYYYRAYVDPSFYTNPQALVDAYPGNTAVMGKVTVIEASPAELRIETAPGFEGSFSVTVTVSDGNRTDSEDFIVNVRAPDSCS